MEPRTRRKPGGAGAGTPLRQPEKRAAAPNPARPSTVRKVVAPVPLPQEATRVQTVTVTADETGMRVDRFLEARFPSLSFSHIQRVIRKGELRVNGKRVDGKDRLEAGQSEVSLDRDPEILQAQKILSDAGSYKKLLSPH